MNEALVPPPFASPTMWALFILFVLGMLALDMGLFQRKAHDISFREAIVRCIAWVGLAAVANAAIWYFYGAKPALEFLAGYVVEQSLSIDNIFVFIVIFSYFKVPSASQHRVLFYGILGALIMRSLFVWAGSELLTHFEWTAYLFGAILIITSVKLLTEKIDDIDPEKNILYRLTKKIFPITPTFSGERFFVRQDKKLYATPLLLVLVTIEFTDLVFAVDSVPAIFAITKEPFLVYSSNIFAILGLRSFYFLLHGSLGKFEYLPIGLALVLAFVGCKMIAEPLFAFHISIGASLSVIVGCVAAAILASIFRARRVSSKVDGTT